MTTTFCAKFIFLDSKGIEKYEMKDTCKDIFCMLLIMIITNGKRALCCPRNWVNPSQQCQQYKQLICFTVVRDK